MRATIRGVLTLAAAFALTTASAGVVVAEPATVLPGPYGGCPAGYHHVPGYERCFVNEPAAVIPGQPAPHVWIHTGPMGGCPMGYHPGPYDQRCWPNGAQEWIPAGPMGGCPAGYHPNAWRNRCYPL